MGRVRDTRADQSPADAVERLYREQGDRMWRALLGFAGDPDVARDAEAEAFAQLLRRGAGVRDRERWVWRAAFRIAAGELIVSKPHGPGNLTKGSVDLIVYRGDQVVISVEAKGPERLLRKLLDGMNHCVGSLGPGHGKSDHNKCLGLLLFRSPLFLAVSCGSVRELYHVQFEDGFVRLVAEPDLRLIDC